jgi:inosine/xanthosine triphosphate pyrophosphatase family protein
MNGKEIRRTHILNGQPGPYSTRFEKQTNKENKNIIKRDE